MVREERCATPPVRPHSCCPSRWRQGMDIAPCDALDALRPRPSPTSRCRSPIARAFTYVVPEALASRVRPGAPVVCPFGGRSLVASCWRCARARRPTTRRPSPTPWTRSPPSPRTSSRSSRISRRTTSRPSARPCASRSRRSTGTPPARSRSRRSSAGPAAWGRGDPVGGADVARRGIGDAPRAAGGAPGARAGRGVEPIAKLEERVEGGARRGEATGGGAHGEVEEREAPREPSSATRRRATRPPRRASPSRPSRGPSARRAPRRSSCTALPEAGRPRCTCASSLRRTLPSLTKTAFCKALSLPERTLRLAHLPPVAPRRRPYRHRLPKGRRVARASASMCTRRARRSALTRPSSVSPRNAGGARLGRRYVLDPEASPRSIRASGWNDST